jgi:hypothetical protein
VAYGNETYLAGVIISTIMSTCYWLKDSVDNIFFFDGESVDNIERILPVL